MKFFVGEKLVWKSRWRKNGNCVSMHKSFVQFLCFWFKIMQIFVIFLKFRLLWTKWCNYLLNLVKKSFRNSHLKITFKMFTFAFSLKRSVRQKKNYVKWMVFVYIFTKLSEYVCLIFNKHILPTCQMWLQVMEHPKILLRF